MRCVYEHVQKYGIPVSYYSDRHSIFKTSRNDTTTQFADTQFNRALKNLGIELICAHSPQAKGRVERANKTLQDRLVKEMRLRKISSIEEANRYLPEFIKQHNEKFAVAAQSPQTAHKPLFYKPEALRHILSVQTNRKLSKNLEFSHNRALYQIVGQGHGYRLRHATVTVCEHMNGVRSEPQI
ncbi:hypothetical protein FACS189472_15730 [Alphaproteobacteria bacterium]|nr:hypothetical protein FACS189472_15730 [Alphaproteobacteria bacterium]